VGQDGRSALKAEEHRSDVPGRAGRRLGSSQAWLQSTTRDRDSHRNANPQRAALVAERRTRPRLGSVGWTRSDCGRAWGRLATSIGRRQRPRHARGEQPAPSASTRPQRPAAWAWAPSPSLLMWYSLRGRCWA